VKALVLITMLGMVSPAMADTSGTLDIEMERDWIALTALSDSPENAPSMLARAGVSSEGATALANYMIQGLKDLDQLLKDQTTQTCQRAEALKASRYEYTDTLQRSDADWNAARKNLIVNLGVVLSDADEERVKTWLSQQRSPTVAVDTSDAIGKLRSGEIDHVVTIQRRCGSSGAIRQPLKTTVPVPTEDLVAGLAGDRELPTQLGHLLPLEQPSHKA